MKRLLIRIVLLATATTLASTMAAATPLDSFFREDYVCRATCTDVIKALKLIPMNDGACVGYYRETYEAKTRAAVKRPRPSGTLIYYLMPAGLFDPWHRFASDEILVYHGGFLMIQLLIFKDGHCEKRLLGPDPTKGHVQQSIIPAGTWMGFLAGESGGPGWGLYGVFCSPGFNLEDIRISTGPELGKKFPGAVAMMQELGMYR